MRICDWRRAVEKESVWCARVARSRSIEVGEGEESRGKAGRVAGGRGRLGKRWEGEESDW